MTKYGIREAEALKRWNMGTPAASSNPIRMLLPSTSDYIYYMKVLRMRFCDNAERNFPPVNDLDAPVPTKR